MTVSSAQTLSAEKEKRVASEVNPLIDRYNEWFGDGRTDLIADQIYSSPSFRLTPPGSVAMMTAEAIKKTFDDGRKPLMADRYARSEWVERSIRVLNEGAASVSGSLIRYQNDGTKPGHFAFTYFLGKSADGWRIAAIASHDVTRGIPAK